MTFPPSCGSTTLPEPAKNQPESATVTCPTCHERMVMGLSNEPQTIHCTFCQAPVLVPSRDQVHSQQSVKTNYPAPTVEEYQIASSDNVVSSRPEPGKSQGKSSSKASPSVTLECPTCHELVKAAVGDKPGRVACTFCGVPLSVPDRETLAARRAKTIEPRSSKEIGEYAAGPIPEAPRFRRGNVFDRLAEVRQEEIPQPPSWTFFSGVFTLPWRKDTIVRWAYLSLGFTAIMIIALVLRGLAASFSGMSSGIAAAFFLLPIIWVTFMTLSYAAACGMCVLESTAGGLDQIEGWPDPNWKEWMADFIYMGWIGAIPLAVSYGVAILARLRGIPLVWTVPVAFFVIYPISLMSAMEANSIWVPLTKSIVGSLFKWWWCWLTFYMLSGLMACGLVAAGVFAVNSTNDFVLVALGPLLAAAVLIYARLLGRLGWRMTTQPTRRSYTTIHSK